MRLNYIVIVYESSMQRIMGSVYSLKNTQIKEMLNITQMARISILIENQEFTPCIIWTAKILLFSNLLLALINSSFFLNALIVLEPWIVSPMKLSKGLFVVLFNLTVSFIDSYALLIRKTEISIMNGNIIPIHLTAYIASNET